MEMEKIMVVFLESDIQHWDTFDTTGEMQMNIPLTTVLSKLPRNRKVKICRWVSKEAIEAEYFPKLKGVRFQNWIAMNFELTKDGTRMLNTYANLLENLYYLAEKYRKKQLNAVLVKCDVPRKCTIEYVKAVLKNSLKTGNRIESRSEKYREKIEKAVNHLM